MKNPKILFISRAYPPVVGGIENQNYELGKALSEIAEVEIIANTRGRKFLPVFAPYALMKALVILPKYDILLLGDGNIAIIGWFIKLFSKKPVLCVIHGLDINYNSTSLKVWYENLLIFLHKNLWVKIFLPSLDKFIAVGNETVRVGIEKGIPLKKLVFIPNGVDTEKNLINATISDLEKIIGRNIQNKKILLTSGRLARRKGVNWFVGNVMPKLAENILYVIAGDGVDKQNITDTIKKNHLENRVIMLGYVTDENRNILWNTCDLFVQPNIKIQGDMEGFGISVIEAASCRMPVLAANLEGLKDAIKDNENGFLIESENAEAWAKKINELLSNEKYCKEFGEKARQFVIENYEWKKIAQKYLNEININILIKK
jgi:glycosyltransferase involved in cell wall biosynthesis